MLQVVEGSTIGDRSGESTELQGRHADAFAERAHAAYTALCRGDLFVRIGAEVFASDIVAGEFAESEFVRVVLHAVEAKTAPKYFKVRVVRLGDGLREVHMPSAEVDRRVFGDCAFAKSGERDGDLDG